MAELKFKHGSYLDLMNANGTPNTTKTPISEGTIYVTTDERAMFVDLKKPSENTASRIRLEGAVQYYDTLEEFTATTKPPYSQTSLYFFRRLKNSKGAYDVVNAFMAWDGTEWKQVNVSKADFVALSERVSNAETAIGELSSNANTLKGRVDAILTINGSTRTGYIKNIEDRLDAIHGTNGTGGDIKGIKDRLDAIHGTNGTGGDIKGIKDRLDVLDTATTGKVPALETAVGTHESRLDALLDRNAQNEETGRIVIIEEAIAGLDERLTDLDETNGRMDDVEDRLDALDGTNGKIAIIERDLRALDNGTNGRVTVLEGTASNLSGRVGTLEINMTNLIKTNGRLDQIESDVDDNAKAIDDNAKAIEDLEKLIGSGDGTGSDLSGRLKTAEGEIDELQGAVNTINNTTIPGINSAIGGQATAISGLQGRMTTAESNISNLQGRMTTAEGEIDDLQGRMTTAEGEIDTLQIAVNTINNTTIPTLAVKTEVAEDIAKLKTELQAEIDSDINAANAMTFKGVIATENDLPTSGVRIGDTYVLSQTDSHAGNDTTIDYSAGDFFIAGKKDANVKENDDGYLPSDGIKWSHVKSGYDNAFDPSFQTAITNATSNTSGSAIISLGNFAGANLGQVTLAPSGNIKIKGDTGNTATARTINISLEWGTF